VLGIARIASAVAFAAYLLAALWLGRLERGGPAHGDLLLAGGVPATLYLPAARGAGARAFLDPPPREARPPAIALMHGFAGDRVALSSLARRLADSGYAVLAFDARGHGENRSPLRRGLVRADAFRDDFAAAIDYLRLSPFVDGERLAVMGHSMGAGAALDFATRDAGLDAAVLISGGFRLDGPYRPANALFLVAERDPPRIRSRAAELAARLAEMPSAEPGRSYGSFAAGTAVRLALVPETDHLSIVWRGAPLREMVAWLDASFGLASPRGDPPRDERVPALLALAAAFVLLLPGLGLLVAWLAPARDPLPANGRRGLAALALALAAASPLVAAGSPAEILSLEVADAVVALLALAGLALLVWIRLREPGLLSFELRDPLPSALAGGAGLVALFVLAHPFGAALHRSSLTPERMAAFALAAAGAFPFALAFACLLRRGSSLRAFLCALAGRALVVALLVAGVATGALGSVVLLLLPLFCGVFAAVEVLAAFAYAGSRNLLAIALVDAGWLAAVAAAILPVRV
jgi:alpha-beta hydrolase superfamily lysophospholipase